MLAVALAAVSYAVAAVYTRRRLTGQPLVEAGDGTPRAPRPHEIALGSTLAALLVVTVLALVFERPAGGLVDLPQTARPGSRCSGSGCSGPASPTCSSSASWNAGVPRGRRW